MAADSHAKLSVKNREHVKVAFAWCQGARLFGETMVDRAVLGELQMDLSAQAALKVLRGMIDQAAQELDELLSGETEDEE